MRPVFALALVVSLSVLSPGPRAHADTVRNAITSNALTNNALTGNAITSNALTNNALTNNAITSNALTNNALTGNAIATQPAGAAVSDLNGVGVEGVVLPARLR